MKHKDTLRLLRDLERQGFEVAKAKRNGHFKVRKNGKVVTIIACSPSDHRAAKNNLARLKRHGYEPGPGVSS